MYWCTGKSIQSKLNLLYVMCVYVQLRVRCGSCVDTVDGNSGEKVDKT